MLTDTWIIGESATLPLQITDAAGALIDAAAIRLLIKPPGQPVVTIAAPARLSLGQYRHILPLDRAGHWYYRWEVSAPLPAVAEGSLRVEPSRFA